MLDERVPTGFRPVLGIWTGASTIVAVVIGAGIFSVPQRVAGYLGGTVEILGLWLVVGLVCLVTALVYAEVAARFPRAGADYVALRAAYGRHVAFVFGWRGLALSHPSNRAALALVGAQYAVVLVPALAGAELAVGVGLILALGLVNAVGMRQATLVHSALTAIKVGLLLSFVGLALATASPVVGAGDHGGNPAGAGFWSSSPTVDGSAPERWALASLLIFFAYTGFPRVVQVTEEFRSPKRSMPWSMGLAVGAVIVLYLAINYAYLRLLGLEGVRATPTVGADAMAVVFGAGGASLVAFIIVVSVAGSVSVSMMAASRLYYAMSQGGDFFRALGKLHPVARVPTRALAVHVVLAIVLLIVRGNFVDLVLSATFLNLAFYALRVQSLFVLRRRGLGEPDGFRMPWYPWLPMLALVSMYGVLVTRLVLDWERAWFDVLVLVIGLAVSWVWFRRVDQAGGGPGDGQQPGAASSS